MNTRQLKYFVTVAQSGSFTAAAKILGMAQPPLSKQISLLEEELGVTLFERRARKSVLTHEGWVLYNRATAILDMVEVTKKEVTDSAQGMSATLRLGVISSCGNALLQGRLERFCHSHPQVRFEVFESNTYHLLEDLNNGVIDAAVVRTPFSEDGLCANYIDPEPLVAVGDASFFKGLGERISLCDLKDVPLIFYRRFEHILMGIFSQSGITPRVFCKNDDARTSIFWARTKKGVAIVPQSIFRLLDDGALESRVISNEMTVTRVAAICKKDGNVPQLAREFVEDFNKGEVEND